MQRRQLLKRMGQAGALTVGGAGAASGTGGLGAAEANYVVTTDDWGRRVRLRIAEFERQFDRDVSTTDSCSECEAECCSQCPDWCDSKCGGCLCAGDC